MKQILVELKKNVPIDQQMNQILNLWNTGLYRNLLLHIIYGWSDEEQILSVARDVRNCCPQAKIVGSMSAGEVKDGKLMERGILLSALLFKSADVRLFCFDSISGNETEVGKSLSQQINTIAHIKGVEMILPGIEVDTAALYKQLCRCKKHIQFFGGYSGGHALNSPKHYIFTPDGILPDGLLAVTYAGEDFHLNVDKTIGWDALGSPFRVTKADQTRLIELDNRPASEVYEKFLQIDRRQHNNAQDGYEFPLMAKYQGDELLRSTVHIEEDGSLDLHGFVTEGMDIYLSYGNPTNILERVNERLEIVRRFQPEVVLLFSCVVRKTFWKEFVNIEMEPFASIGSTFGMHTWGEIVRNLRTGEIMEHNVTLVSVAMREGAPSTEPLPVVRVDEGMLKGQASLLKRMTSLVYTTMEELQKAHNNLRVLNERLRLMAEHDALTRLYNRGTIEGLINEALDAAAESGTSVSLIMVDIDHFKQVNDHYGHDVGDMALFQVANILNSSSSRHSGAKAGRWGGEEFFVLLPNATEDVVFAEAEHLRQETQNHRFPTVGELTISLGVITATGREKHNLVFTAVDNALYQAKANGRNQTIRAKCPPPEEE